MLRRWQDPGTVEGHCAVSVQTMEIFCVTASLHLEPRFLSLNLHQGGHSDLATGRRTFALLT